MIIPCSKRKAAACSTKGLYDDAQLLLLMFVSKIHNDSNQLKRIKYRDWLSR